MDAVILSNGLDTNGQNFRYVEAARKHGADVLTVLAIGKSDPAGIVGRYKDAADKGDELRIRSASRAKYEYLQFPMDIYWDRHAERQIKELAAAADVIHLNNSEMAYRRLGLRGKPALLHHHGSLFRSNPQRMLNLAARMRWEQAVSTIDLTKPAPDILTWLPTAYDIDGLQARSDGNTNETVRIAHAPTNRDLKYTAVFLEATRQLAEEGLPIDVDLIEGTTWAECMERKSRADILYDQMAFGYGCNAVEAWGMGIPVVAGADDPWVLEQMEARWTPGIPFVTADPSSLKSVLRRLVESADLRRYWADVGLAHVRKYHDEKPALTVLVELYHKAITRYAGRRIPSKLPSPVTFTQRGRRPVYDDEGRQIAFVDGRIETDDGNLVDRLRKFAERPMAFGITEMEPAKGEGLDELRVDGITA